jgi:uncharacterized damage-inducible protein DinB
MAIRDGLLNEFDNEVAGTRKTLERVPEKLFAWKPHDKSMSMGDLASHIANLPSWIGHTIGADSLDLMPVGKPKVETPKAKTNKELLEMFDKNVAEGRAILAKAEDAEMHRNWSLMGGGKVFFTMPKIAVLRSFVFNHNVHHRAQLGVYLRLNDIPVPSLYGPSADESGM